MLQPVPQTQSDAQAPRKGVVRAMSAADVPGVARLFLKIFRGVDKPADADLENYLQALVLGSPSYSEDRGTHIYQQQDGRIRSALLSVPMRFVACGTVVPGRLLGVFMSDANKEAAAGAAQLILALRPRRSDFSFCDSASPTSADHLLAIGGKAIPVQNLEWARSFRPLGALAARFSLRFLRRHDPGLATLVRPIDALLSRMRGGNDVEESTALKVTDMSVPAFIAQAPRLIAHYAVRPLWSEDELGWLVALAAQNTKLGAFTIQAVEDRDGAIVGCFVYYAAPGRTAHVLNVLSLPGREIAVLSAMFRHLERAGHVEARGRAQPALMAGLALQRWLVFRHRAFAMTLTRVADVKDAVARGDIYVGGLAGEDWSRLMCDFG